MCVGCCTYFLLLCWKGAAAVDLAAGKRCTLGCDREVACAGEPKECVVVSIQRVCALRLEWVDGRTVGTEGRPVGAITAFEQDVKGVAADVAAVFEPVC